MKNVLLLFLCISFFSVDAMGEEEKKSIGCEIFSQKLVEVESSLVDFSIKKGQDFIETINKTEESINCLYNKMTDSITGEHVLRSQQVCDVGLRKFIFCPEIEKVVTSATIFLSSGLFTDVHAVKIVSTQTKSGNYIERVTAVLPDRAIIERIKKDINAYWLKLNEEGWRY